MGSRSASCGLPDVLVWLLLPVRLKLPLSATPTILLFPGISDATRSREMSGPDEAILLATIVLLRLTGTFESPLLRAIPPPLSASLKTIVQLDTSKVLAPSKVLRAMPPPGPAVALLPEKVELIALRPVETTP